jgi:hypothetical protein
MPGAISHRPIIGTSSPPGNRETAGLVTIA